jgi:hypothetical protein
MPEINTKPGWKVYKHVKLDTLKLYTKAHGSKTTNLIINLDHDDWILNNDEATLASLGIGTNTDTSRLQLTTQKMRRRYHFSTKMTLKHLKWIRRRSGCNDRQAKIAPG